MGRLDHFVSKPPTLNLYTGNYMSNNNPVTTSLTNNGANMPFPQNCRSITLSRGFQSSHNTWVNTMRKNGASKHTRVWGRIKDTGANFIVEGWNLWENGGNWVQIPCANLATAQIHLLSVMDKKTFKAEQLRQAWDRMEREGKSYDEIMETLGY